MNERILIIEDAEDIARMSSIYLERKGYSVTLALDGEEGLQHLRTGNYDLVILDLNLPGMDGLAVCHTLRDERSTIPVLMLTSRTSVSDIVLGLEIGADDYLTKPFDFQVLLARVKSLLRRIAPQADRAAADQTACIRLGRLLIDPIKRKVTIGGTKVHLSAKEFDLLLYLARNPGRVLTRDQLLDSIWGDATEVYEHTVNSHINRLRAKIEHDPTNPAYILTEWKVGYRFCEPDDCP